MRLVAPTRRALHRLGGAALALTLSAPAWAQAEGYDRYHGPGMMWNGGWAGWIVGPLMMLAFLAAAVAVVVVVVRWLGGGATSHQPPDGGGGGRAASALEILEQRFARGEIDEEEFRRRKQALSE